MKKFSIVYAFFLLLISSHSSASDEELIKKMLKAPIAEQVDLNKQLEAQYAFCKIENGTTSNLSKSCKEKTTPQLRNLMRTFYANQPKEIQTDELRTKLAKLMGMFMEESSGNPSAVSDMNGNGSKKSYLSFFKLNQSGGVDWKPHFSNTDYLEERLAQGGTLINEETNFGLSQLSANRLYIKKWGGNYFKTILPLIKNMPTNELLNWCMTRSIYNDGEDKLKNYVSKIKACEIGYKSKEEIKCYGRLVMFCPRLTIDVALLQDVKKYFETSNADPLCHNLFK